MGEEQKANYKVEMQSSTVRIGEEVVLRVTIDNRACEKPLEPVQIKFSSTGEMFNDTRCGWKCNYKRKQG